MVTVGKSLLRMDAEGKATGSTKYGGDLYEKGMLFARVLRSRYASADILSIETAEAKAADGVVGIYTAKDVEGTGRTGLIARDQDVLARDHVRYMGDALAVVLADTEAQAAAALALINVDYQPRPAIHTIDEALAPDAPRIHEYGNLMGGKRIRRGNAERALEDESDVVVEETFQTQTVDHAFLDLEAGYAEYDGDTLTLHVSGQWVHEERRLCALALGLPIEKVRIIQPATGGAFGGREDISIQMYLGICALSNPGRKIYMRYSRSESMIARHKRHAIRCHYRLGAKSDGTLVAAKVTVWSDEGAYASTGIAVMRKASSHSTGPYRVPHVSVDVYGVHTNNNPTGAMRGFGAAQMAIAYEGMMDRLAEKLGMDPIEIRRKNLLESGEAVTTSQIIPLVTAKECMDAALAQWAKGGKVGEGPILPMRESSSGFQPETDGSNQSSSGFQPEADGSNTRPDFKPVNPFRSSDLTVRNRSLPHLSVTDATYFVTFRCWGQVILTPPARDAVMAAIRFWDGQKIYLRSAVVMPDHVHMIVQMMGDVALGKVLHSIKSFSAKQVNAVLGSSGPVWQTDSFDHIIRDEHDLIEKSEYVRLNPESRGLVREGENYQWLYEAAETAAGSVEDSVGKGSGEAESVLAVSSRLEACSTKTKAVWDERSYETPAPWIKRGYGLSVFCFGLGYGDGFPDASRARVCFNDQDELEVYSGAVEVGQGLLNMIAQVAAQEVGIPIDQVRVIAADTALTPEAGSSSATRQTYFTGSAVKIACSELREHLLDVAQNRLGVHPLDVRVENGIMSEAANPENFVPVSEVLAEARRRGVKLEASALFKPQTVVENPDTGLSPRAFITYLFGAHIAQVLVDTETGQVTVERYIACHDVGHAINPVQVEGQIQGGVTQGIGMALMEEVLMNQDGRMLNAGFTDYIIPSCTDVPDIEAVILEYADAGGPFGARGVGEPPLIGVSPAINSAIHDAIGLWPKESPSTSERIWRLLQEGSPGSAGVPPAKPRHEQTADVTEPSASHGL